jgi:hypothetical protein
MSGDKLDEGGVRGLVINWVGGESIIRGLPRAIRDWQV